MLFTYSIVFIMEIFEIAYGSKFDVDQRARSLLAPSFFLKKPTMYSVHQVITQ